jgi:hypothetical protein
MVIQDDPAARRSTKRTDYRSGTGLRQRRHVASIAGAKHPTVTSEVSDIRSRGFSTPYVWSS